MTAGFHSAETKVLRVPSPGRRPLPGSGCSAGESGSWCAAQTPVPAPAPPAHNRTRTTEASRQQLIGPYRPADDHPLTSACFSFSIACSSDTLSLSLSLSLRSLKPSSSDALSCASMCDSRSNKTLFCTEEQNESWLAQGAAGDDRAGFKHQWIWCWTVQNNKII